MNQFKRKAVYMCVYTNQFVFILYNVFFHCVGETTSTCSTGNIIGKNTGVYIGGIPRDYITYQNSADSRYIVSLSVGMTLYFSWCK